MKKKTAMVCLLQSASILCLVVVMLFGVTLSAYSARPQGVTDDTINVGVILDQTGPISDLIVPVTKGLRSLFRYTNEQGGINGRKLKLIVEDDRCAIPLSVSAFKKLLYRDGVVSLIGPTSLSSTVALLKSIEKEKIPTIPGSPSEMMVNPVQRYIFTIQDISSGQMNIIVDYIIKDLKGKDSRIALVYSDTEAGKTDLDPALKRLKLYNIEPVAKEVFNYTSIEATSQVMNLRKAKVDYIILCGHISQSAITMLREMSRFNLNVPLFGGWATCNETIMDIGEAANQFYATNAMASWYDEGPGVAKMREITLKYEPGTEKPYRGKTYTAGWLEGLIIIEALKRAGRDLDGEAIVRGLETMNNFNTGGVSGTISYSPTDHKGGDAWKIFKSDPSSGKFAPMTEWRNSQ
ncbi:MAG: ABC transporter substrate-binding protein [Pseudomonadota bacterium]